VAWVRIEPDIFGNRKLQGCSMAAKLLYLGAIAYSNQNLRDGVLSQSDLAVVAAGVEVKLGSRTVTELVGRRLFEDGEGGEVRIHDYLKYQPSRADVLRDRAASTDRKSRWRSRRKNGVTDAVTPGEVTA
jgi:hypothetical protein